MALTDILTRVTTHPDLTAKGAELTYTEGDNNLIIIYEALKALNSGAGLTPYDPGADYVGTYYVSYNNNIWEHIGTGVSTGVTPGTDPLVWQIASIGQIIHAQNTDLYLALGTPFEVSAIQLNGIYKSLVISVSLSGLITTIGLNQLRPGYWYYISDKFVLLKALTDELMDESGGILLARNPDYQDKTGLMLKVGSGANETAVWGPTGSNWWTKVLVAFPSSGARQNKIAIYKGFHYKNLTGNNSATTPDADATNWLLLAKTDSSYIIEAEKCEVDLTDSCRILYREDARGNKIRKPTGLELENTFEFGNDKVTNNVVEGKLTIANNWGFVQGNYIQKTSQATIDGNGDNSTFVSAVSYNMLEHASIVISNNKGSIDHVNIDDTPLVCSGNQGSISYSHFRKDSSSVVMTNNLGTISQSIFERCGGLTLALTSGAGSIERTTIINASLSNPVLDLGSSNDDLYFAPGYPLPPEYGSVIIASNQIDVSSYKVVEADATTGSGIVFTITSSFNGNLVKISSKPGSGSFYVDTAIGNIQNHVPGSALTDWNIDDALGDYMIGFYIDNVFRVLFMQSS